MSKGLFDRVEGELEAREKSPGLSMSDLLALPDVPSRLLNWMMRQGQVTLADAMTFLAQDETQTRALLDDLRSKGYIREIEMRGITQFRVRLAPKRGRALPANLWAALDDKVEHGEEERK